ncbi:class I SAM-dependent methyltransferase [Bacillus timonensis]|nr:class I SAM-dependent methyltransferase [Bacillus timonensis]
MSTQSPVENLFYLFDKTANIIQQELNCTYLEALAETAENVFHQSIIQDEISEMTKKRLEKEYQAVPIGHYSNEEIRKAYQLSLLKGMKHSTQSNHQMTPDAVSLFMGYLASKCMDNRKNISILDPAVGTGNLLTSIMNHIPSKEMIGFGSEIDDLLIRLAYNNSNLQKHTIQFFNQDSLEPLYIDPVDLVVCDIPIGYYPNDIGASKFSLKSNDGHSYSHHLFIEQSVKHTKAGGYLLLLIPNHLFTSDQADKMHRFIKEQCIIQGLVQLPLSMFKDEKSAKSIFILQKKGNEVTQPKQALLVDLPKFSNKDAMRGIIARIDSWFKTEKQPSTR